MIKKSTFLNTIFIVAAFITVNLIPVKSYAGSWNGWIYQNPYPTSDTLLAIKFVTPVKGWVAGERGTILYTENGGDTWVLQESGTDQRIWKIYFLNEKVGWAVGDRGVIQHTDDAGKSWVAQGGSTASVLHSVFFINQKEGWAAGNEGTVLYTTDGGKQWEKRDIGATRSIGCVRFINSQTGWILAGDEIYRTADGGKSWEKSSLSIKMPRSGAVGSGTIINMVGETVPDDWWKGDLFFADEKNGWAVVGLWYVFHTTDGGKTWANQLSTGYMSYGLLRLAFTDKKSGCAVGSSILCTEDGGNTWSEKLGIKPGRREKINDYDISLMDVSFVDQRVAWAAGEEGQIMHTENGGKTWTMVSRHNQCGGNAFFINNKTGWLHKSGSQFVCRTDDGGLSMQKQDVGIDVEGIFFINDKKGWAVGARKKAEGEKSPGGGCPCPGKVWAAIKKTTDGGKTWKTQFEELIAKDLFENGLFSIYFSDAKTGWAVGNQGIILHTSDSGLHWEHQKTRSSKLFLRGIQFVSPKIGWITGTKVHEGWTGVVLHTVDGGGHWENQYKLDDIGLNGIFFLDRNNGWITGQSEDERTSTILRTINEGQTWTQEKFEDIGYSEIAFLDKQHGVISTERGWLLVTNDGGTKWYKKQKPIIKYPFHFSDILIKKNIH